MSGLFESRLFDLANGTRCQNCDGIPQGKNKVRRNRGWPIIIRQKVQRKKFKIFKCCALNHMFYGQDDIHVYFLQSTCPAILLGILLSNP